MWRIRWLWKNTVEDYPKRISTKFLKKYWYLDKVGQSGALYWSINWKRIWNIWIEVNKSEYYWYLRVHFTQTDREWNKKDFDYKIKLESLKCNYWWVRWFFICPCWWNRCSILYLQNNWIFASRKTLDLCYEDQNQSKRWRYFDKILPKDFEAEELYKTIKYPYRNWKPTRKYKKYLKLIKDDMDMKDILKFEEAFLLK